MVDSFPFPVSNSELASAALRASKQLNQVADSARASEGKAAQSCNKLSQPKQWKGSNKESTRLPCPHCKWPSVIRTSEQMSVLTRRAVYCCVNAECGHTFVANTEVSHTLSPSATPDPSVNLTPDAWLNVRGRALANREQELHTTLTVLQELVSAPMQITEPTH